MLIREEDLNMQPTIEILERLKSSSKKNPDEIFTRLFRYLLREDIYFVAYKNLYANKGAGTKGIDNDTADGFSYEYVHKIIQRLAKGEYMPKATRRVEIPKKNGKMRPLSIPSFADKLVQEVIRMILEAIYEPLFLECSHGFRPKRSCHTALEAIKGWNGTKWFVEGDIRGCFDCIDHNQLMKIIGNKIRDKRLFDLIRKFLKAGYMQNWQYHNTYSGTPQGGIISPILANIYLHELDKFVLKIKHEFDKKPERYLNPDYKLISSKIERFKRRIGNASGSERESLLKEYAEARKQLLQTPCKSQTDKKLKYVRYADDFVIGLNGSKEDGESIKAAVKEFLSKELKLELSDEKTLITHSSNPCMFLGYYVSVRREQKVKPDKNGVLKRSLSHMVQLTVPFHEKIEPFLWSRNTVRIKQGRLFPAKRDYLLNLTDLEIVSTYCAEMRGLLNFYDKAVDYYKLSYFAYLMEYSCLMTLARKHKTSIGKIITKYKDGKGRWGVPYETKEGKKRLYLPRTADCKGNPIKDEISKNTKSHSYSRTTFESRLQAKTCELCGASGDIPFEIHHVNKVKNLKGKSRWEQIMIAKKRKTLVVCQKCHREIHKSRT